MTLDCTTVLKKSALMIMTLWKIIKSKSNIGYIVVLS